MVFGPIRYHCVYCDEKRYGSERKLIKHFNTVHNQVVVEAIQETINSVVANEDEVVIEMNLSQMDERNEEVPLDLRGQDDDREDTVFQDVNDEMVQCDLCDKWYKSAKGLSIHKGHKHKELRHQGVFVEVIGIPLSLGGNVEICNSNTKAN